MGNSGSAHNLHNDCVDSELNSYYTQQYLRRTTEETRRKYNQNVLGGWSNGRNVADCKVLPTPTENLKLRATTNGAILQAGGTISLRTKEQSDMEIRSNLLPEHKTDPAMFYPIRRCHTLILDSQNDSISYRKSAPPPGELRRSQTMLHVGYNKSKSQDSSLANLDCSPRSLKSNTSTTSTLKVNKYNKKRKAPPAPAKVPLEADSTSSGQNISAKTKITTLAKPRIYETKNNKISVTQKLQQKANKPQPQLIKIAPFQRNSNTRTSINSSGAIKQSNLSICSKLPYRREKSFDAVLLIRRGTNECSDRSASIQNIQMKRELSNPQVANVSEENTDLITIDSNRKKNICKQHDSVTANTLYPSKSNYCNEAYKAVERFRQEISPQFNSKKDTSSKSPRHASESGCLSTTNERRPKCQQSRIPQLKRTFYFGMETSNKSSVLNTSQTEKAQCANEKNAEEIEDIAILNHNIEAEEEIVDNGILVHVRPTLPRRQPETPVFSPAAAWRNLLEEQQRLKKERFIPKQNIFNSRILESPICLPLSQTENFSPTAASWTPQQDLEGDNDDEEEYEQEQGCKTTNPLGKVGTELENQRNSNSLHIFSLSLPRDVHLQCQIKSSLDYMEQENNFKAADCWLVPGFNSLKKFKTHLGKNLNSRSNTKCTCAPNATIKRNSYQLQNIFSDSIAADTKNNHQPDCELYKTSQEPLSCHNDNWFLHKSKSNIVPLDAAVKTSGDSSLNYSLNSHSLVNLQPKTLTNICGGKHIVYLPTQDNFVASFKNSYKNPKQIKTTKSIRKRQYQRQEIFRESLQDLTPIQDIHQSNVCVPEKNTHRFSFQSTVRVLEKRRLAEKLSKDAEIQEAQRLNELEAMKRVEEDFQRKRAPEKANLRNQLRLHLKANTENEEYRSLPLSINKGSNSQPPKQQRVLDVNNNLFCRAEPDGAVSPSFLLNDNLHKTRLPNSTLASKQSSKQLILFESDGDESESQLPDMQCTASLIEPYLHSII